MGGCVVRGKAPVGRAKEAPEKTNIITRVTAHGKRRLASHKVKIWADLLI